MSDLSHNGASDLIAMTVRIVAAYVKHHNVENIPSLIETVHAALSALGIEEPVVLEPAVPIQKSVQPDYLVCLEDGRRFKMLKRYLRQHYGLTPDEYRKRWGLPPDYPMIAPNYARTRSEMAKHHGLGLNK